MAERARGVPAWMAPAAAAPPEGQPTGRSVMEDAGATPQAGRITTDESFLDLVDHLAHGDLATWRRVYAAARRDAAVRAAVARAACLVDPDFATAGALWRALVDRLPPLPQQDQSQTEVVGTRS